MASEMRRIAMLLVERRTEAFASRHPREESERRVRQALEGFVPKGMVYEMAWRDEGGAAHLDVTYAPSRGTRSFLNAMSIVLLLLLAACVWAYTAGAAPAPVRIMLVIFTVLALLAFPFVVVAFGSRREAEESVLRRRVRKAIVEEEEEAR